MAGWRQLLVRLGRLVVAVQEERELVVLEVRWVEHLVDLMEAMEEVQHLVEEAKEDPRQVAKVELHQVALAEAADRELAAAAQDSALLCLCSPTHVSTSDYYLIRY